MKTLLYFIIFLSVVTQSITAQDFQEIEKSINDFNAKGKFENSIEVIDNYLNNENVSAYNKYRIYILKSYTHKSLFDYNKTLESLDLALLEGVKSDKKDEVVANVKAEKAFAYFDTQKYKESSVLMNELKASNYKNLDLGTTSYIIMQDGYLDFLNGNYLSSEKKYNDAILFMKRVEPHNLPVIYGKKVLLYSKMRDQNNALAAFNEAKKIASNPKNLKYLLYLNESLRTFYEENEQWKLADKIFHRADSLRTMYNAEENSNKIELLEKDLVISKKESQLENSNLWRNFLLILCSGLLVGLYLFFKFLKSNKEKNILLEKENTRIRDELQILTNSLNTQGFTKVDLAKFNLSERQLEIIELIRQGKSNKEIANTIFISENTVKYHLKSIYDILNIENRSEFFKFINE